MLATSEKSFHRPENKMELTRGLHEIDPLRDPRWEEFVERHPHSSVFHSLPWLRALRDAYRYKPVVLTTSTPGAPLEDGVLFCHVKSRLTGQRLVSLPFSDHCDPLVDVPFDNAVNVTEMLARSCRKPFQYLEIRPVSHTPSPDPHLYLQTTFCWHRLDLRPSSALLRGNLHKDCIQRKIRRAEREHLHYEEGNSPELLEAFYFLLTITRRRHGLPPPPLHWFRSLIASFGAALKIRVASKSGIPNASILTLSHKSTMTYKYGASDLAASNLGGMPFLLWHAIEDAKARGQVELDLGRSDPSNHGLVTFKDRWGAARHTLQYWRYAAKPMKNLEAKTRPLAERIMAVCPPVALQTLGALIYKHIG